MESKFIAHINEKDGSVQTVLEHSLNTAELCKQFATPEFQEIAYIAGLAHDLGKWEEDFQKRMRGDSVSVEHSIDGAIEVNKLLPYPIGKLLAYCIAGHRMAGIKMTNLIFQHCMAGYSARIEVFTKHINRNFRFPISIKTSLWICFYWITIIILKL